MDGSGKGMMGGQAGDMQTVSSKFFCVIILCGLDPVFEMMKNVVKPLFVVVWIGCYIGW